ERMVRPGSGPFVAPRRVAARDSAGRSWQAVARGDRVVDDGHVTPLLARAPEGVVQLTGGYLPPGLRPDRQLAAAAMRALRRPEGRGMPPLSGGEAVRRGGALPARGAVAAGGAASRGGGAAGRRRACRAPA